MVAGLAALTTGVRSSSAARRLTKVVFAWRSAGGKATSERSRASFWLAIAPSAWLAFAVRAERSSRRSAIAPSACEPWTRNWLNARLSLVSSANSRRVEDSAGREVLVGLLRALRVAVVERGGALDHVPERRRAFGA